MSNSPHSIDAAVEEWQLDEIRAGIAEVERGAVINHEQVADWLRSWGTPAVAESTPRVYYLPGAAGGAVNNRLTGSRYADTRL